MTPPKIASGTTMMNASSASLAEATSASPRTSDTGGRWPTDSPRSPVRKLVIQSQYCTISGRSVPSSSLSSSTDAWSANGPRIRRATSPGSTWAARKITMLRMNSVIRPRPMRFARKRAMAGPAARVPACRQAFCPAWVMSTWPMADTSTPATVGFVAVR